MSHGPQQNIPIDVQTLGNNTILAGVPGKIIHVLSVVVIVAGPVSIRWKSDGTPLSGFMSLAPNGGYSAQAATEYPRPTQGVLETLPGGALVLELSAAEQVGGHLTYLVK